jgi:hypothetical protein
MILKSGIGLYYLRMDWCMVSADQDLKLYIERPAPPVGESSEFMPWDTNLDKDLKDTVKYHKKLTSEFDEDVPEKFSTSTAERGSRMLAHLPAKESLKILKKRYWNWRKSLKMDIWWLDLKTEVEREGLFKDKYNVYIIVVTGQEKMTHALTNRNTFIHMQKNDWK